jgi:tetratricopeptide (TPR) repeat protein
MIASKAAFVLSLAALAMPQAAAQAQSAHPKAPNFNQLSATAEQARNESRDDQATRLYERGLKLRPGWEQGLWYLGTLLYDKERYSEARDVLRRFVSLEPNTGPGWAMLGLSEFQTREYSRALDHLQRGTVLGFGDRTEMKNSVLYFVAILFTRFEQYDESSDLLFESLASGQEQSLLIDPAGLAALRMPLLPAEIPPDRREMIRMAGEAAIALGAKRHDDAEKIFTNLLTAYPNEPGAHFFAGAYLRNVRPEQGIREMQRELEISPFHVQARTRLAEEYMKEGQFDQALPLAEAAVKLDPKDPSAHLMYGEALVGKQDLAGGIRELETARDQAPQMVRVRWDLVRAYLATGRKDEAKREKDEIEKLSHPGDGPS